jgi:predicted metal-dependent hydrolase
MQMVHSKRVTQRFRIVRSLFKDLQKQHAALRGVGLYLGTFKNRLAYCAFGSKRIAFDSDFLDVASLDTIYHVLVHECAHALCGPRRKAHGPAWHRMCRALGQERPQEVYECYRIAGRGFKDVREAKRSLREANAAIRTF